jgi:hypothetical protein
LQTCRNPMSSHPNCRQIRHSRPPRLPTKPRGRRWAPAW